LDVTQYLTFPGLQAKGIVMGFEVRGAGVRIASTTAHYIEFGTVMATALPFGIHFARFAATQRARRAFGLATLLIAVAVPLTISRTGILALAATIIVMFPVWSWRLRFNIIAAGVAVVAAFMVIKPGLLGTIRDLFLNASQDTSVTARTERYTLVARYFSEHPWLGRGTGTWLAPQYQILDNEWLTFALTNGIVGVAILTAVHLVAIVIALVARRRVTQSLEDRELCTAFVAAQLISLLVAATFDSLSFTTFSMTLALMMGCCGTVWRLTHPTRAVRTSIVVPGA
jgi:O-antigen ligase